MGTGQIEQEDIALWVMGKQILKVFLIAFLLVYLHQDGEIKDEFYIEDKLVEEPRWNKKEDSHTALVMNSAQDEGLEHYGYFEGKGKRELLVFFLGQIHSVKKK